MSSAFQDVFIAEDEAVFLAAAEYSPSATLHQSRVSIDTPPSSPSPLGSHPSTPPDLIISEPDGMTQSAKPQESFTSSFGNLPPIEAASSGSLLVSGSSQQLRRDELESQVRGRSKSPVRRLQIHGTSKYCSMYTCFLSTRCIQAMSIDRMADSMLLIQ